VVVVLLMIAGFQVPVIPLVDVNGKTGGVLPLQIGPMAVKTGVAFGVTVMVMVSFFAHWPADGVNTYDPVVVLFTVAGSHVPVIPLVDVSGKTGGVLPLQIGPMVANAGVIMGETVRFNVTILSHPAVENVSFRPVWDVV
jgi:hypothetical protein